MGQCDSCHTVTLFGLQMFGLYPRYPTYCDQLCLYQSLPSPWWVNSTKNCTLLWRFRHFTRLTKNAKIAIFQFSTRFLKTFPSTDMGPLYLKKIVKPSSTRIYHKTAQLTHPRPSNSPRKVYPMWRDSRYTGRPSKLGIKHSKVLDLTYEVWNLPGRPVAASVILTAFFGGTARTCANCRLYIKCTRVVNTKATSTTTLVLLT